MDAPPLLPMDPSALARSKDPGTGTSAGHEEKQGPQHGRKMKVSSLRPSPSPAREAVYLLPIAPEGNTNTKRPEYVPVFF